MLIKSGTDHLGYVEGRRYVGFFANGSLLGATKSLQFCRAVNNEQVNDAFYTIFSIHSSISSSTFVITSLIVALRQCHVPFEIECPLAWKKT